MGLPGQRGRPDRASCAPRSTSTAPTSSSRGRRPVDGGVEYSWKVWRQGAPEPEQWDLTVLEDNGPPTGSVGVMRATIDIQFGDISVTPIED